MDIGMTKIINLSKVIILRCLLAKRLEMNLKLPLTVLKSISSV